MSALVRISDLKDISRDFGASQESLLKYCELDRLAIAV